MRITNSKMRPSMPSWNLTALGFGDYVSIRRWNKEDDAVLIGLHHLQCVFPLPGPLHTPLPTPSNSTLPLRPLRWFWNTSPINSAAGGLQLELHKVPRCGLSYVGSNIQWKYVGEIEYEYEGKCKEIMVVFWKCTKNYKCNCTLSESSNYNQFLPMSSDYNIDLNNYLSIAWFTGANRHSMPSNQTWREREREIAR